jgi:hypothetical protein
MLKFAKLILVALLLFTTCKKGADEPTIVIPLAPSGLNAVQTPSTQVNLNWTDNSTNEEGFKIERKFGAGNYELIGTVSENITTYSDQNNIQPGKAYVYRVYAYNKAGNSITYSNESSINSFNFPGLSTAVISQNTGTAAVSGGTINTDGGSAITARGVVWSTSPNPTISLSTKTNDGGFNGTFTSNLSGLTLGTTYYARAYATNAVGTAYGNEITFTTASLPVLTTSVIDKNYGFTAISGGSITNEGGSYVTSRGVVWSTSPNPTISLSTKTNDGGFNGTFTSNLIGLTPGSTYYVRAYATNAVGTAYGNEITFTTLINDLKTGLVAYYPFNGNAIDESDNGNHGTVYGATLSTDRFGNANKAYLFNNNSIQVANSSSLNPTTISISLWFLSTGTNMNLISKNNPNDASSVSFKITLDDFQVIQRGLHIGFGRGVCNSVGDYFSYWSPFGAIQQNVWNNLIVTIRSNGQISCYINGSLSFTSNGDFNKNLPCNNNASILKIGGPWWNSDPEYFKGKIDDIRIYERVLTPTEINYIATN